MVGSDNCSVEGRGEHENLGIVVIATEGEGEVGESRWVERRVEVVVGGERVDGSTMKTVLLRGVVMEDD